MGIKVIAIAPYDEWAFIEKEGEIFLLRPPYTASNLVEVSEQVVGNAIHKYGFVECDFTFSSMREVVRFLKETFVRLMKEQGIGTPSSEELRGLLKYATDDVLLEYLKKAEKELIPEGKLDAAEAIALELMKLEKVKNDLRMLDMCRDILEKCSQTRRRLKEELASEMSNNQEETWNDKFPDVFGTCSIRDITRLAKTIAERGQILPVGC